MNLFPKNKLNNIKSIIIFSVLSLNLITAMAHGEVNSDFRFDSDLIDLPPGTKIVLKSDLQFPPNDDSVEFITFITNDVNLHCRINLKDSNASGVILKAPIELNVNSISNENAERPNDDSYSRSNRKHSHVKRVYSIQISSDREILDSVKCFQRGYIGISYNITIGELAESLTENQSSLLIMPNPIQN